MTTLVRSRLLGLGGIVLVAVAALIALDAFGSSGTSGAARPDRDGVLEVVMEDYRFAPTAFAIGSEQPVTFVFDNRDEVSHDVSIGRTVAEHDGRAIGFAEDLLAGIPVQVTPRSASITPEPPYQGTTVVVPGGQRVELELIVPASRAGEWQIGCFTGRGCHYRAGLAAELLVE
jgi:hypothetical protein